MPGLSTPPAPFQQPRTLAGEAAGLLRRSIQRRVYGPGEQLPSEPALARQLGLSRGTLRESITVLEREGLLFRRQGLGTFVVERSGLCSELNVNSGLSELIRGAGRRPGVADLKVGRVLASAPIAHCLQLSEGAALLLVERTHTADDKAVARTLDHLPLALLESRGLAAAGLQAALLQGQSLYACLREVGLSVHGGIADISAAVADRALARALGVRPGVPLLRLKQVDYLGRGGPVLHSEEYLVAGVTVQVSRKGPE